MDTISQVNPRLRAAIKLRHLLDATAENWHQLSQIRERIKAIIEDATAFMNAYGTSQAKERYASEMPELMKNVDGVGGMLMTISEAIKKKEADVVKTRLI